MYQERVATPIFFSHAFTYALLELTLQAAQAQVRPEFVKEESIHRGRGTKVIRVSIRNASARYAVLSCVDLNARCSVCACAPSTQLSPLGLFYFHKKTSWSEKTAKKKIVTNNILFVNILPEIVTNSILFVTILPEIVTNNILFVTILPEIATYSILFVTILPEIVTNSILVCYFFYACLLRHDESRG